MIKMNLDKKFSEICKNGNLTEVVEFHNKWKHSINIHANNERAFRFSCMYGHLDVAKWLWKISNERINIHTDNEYSFRSSCWYGESKMAKWLWKISNETITICDFMFGICCQYGQRDTAKWLLEIGDINIHAKNDIAFKYSCENYQTNTAIWLLHIFFDEKYHNDKLKKYCNIFHGLEKLFDRNARVIGKFNDISIINDMVERLKWLHDNYDNKWILMICQNTKLP